MPKFSIIIPVYNTSSFLPICFDSILSQSFKDYEVIIVNDGSTDNSQKIIDKFCRRYKDKFKSFITKNNGLSEARNYGVKESIGDYLLFVDSDDYIEKNLLKKIDSVLKSDVDLVRFQLKTINTNYKVIERFHEEEFKNLTGPESFLKIINYKFVELACCYVYNRKFYLKNKFKFKKNMYHEDFGLIPYIIMKANNITSIDYIGYNYVQRDNSIMSTTDYSKNKKKVYDALKHYKYLYDKIEKLKDVDEKYKKIFYSFIANSVVLKGHDLNSEDLKEFDKELDKLEIKDKLIDDTLIRKLKKSLLKINLKMYLKVVK